METAEGDPHLRKRLAQLLCCSDKGWATALDHVLCAVPPDTRLRAFHEFGSEGVGTHLQGRHAEHRRC